MARTFPAASAVTTGSGSCAVPASASPPSGVPPTEAGPGCPASAGLPDGPAADCPASASVPGSSGAGAGFVAASGALRAACGAGFLVRAMVVTPFPVLRRNSRFQLSAPVFSGRQLLWSGREVKRLRGNSSCCFLPPSWRPRNMPGLCSHLALHLAHTAWPTASRTAIGPYSAFRIWGREFLRPPPSLFPGVNLRAATRCAHSPAPAPEAHERAGPAGRRAGPPPQAWRSGGAGAGGDRLSDGRALTDL